MPPKLLLADDSITVQRVIALTFQGEGIDVIAVGDGDQAVETIERERPQIVLADLSMPGRDGYAVAEHVKRSPTLAAQTRVVLLTGAFEPVEEHRSKTLGIDGVLAKPFEPQVAIALVRRLLAQPPLAPRDADAGPATQGQAAGEAMANAGGSMSTGGGEAVDAAAGYPFEPQQGSAGASSLALDDYFKRLDEALASAGLASPAAALPVAQAALRESPTVTVPSTHAVSADAETMVMTRPVLHDEPPVLRPERAAVPEPAAAIEPAASWPAVETVQAAAESAAAEEVEVSVVTEEAEESGAIEFTAADEHMAGGETFVAPPEEEPVQQDTPVAGVALVDAFSALLAAEEGRGDVPLPSLAAPAPAVSQAAAPAAPAVDLDALADTVARKVLAQLTDARIDAIVSERVLEVAERLVREEIERIKAEAQ